jgi:3-oxoacyl-(acyl-carrier-protein) synthase/pimeloyl-ACP methyl ester carboxylesterase
MKRVVVTGIGVIAPNGIGRREFWRAGTAGRVALRGEPQMASLGLRSRSAAPVVGFNLENYHQPADVVELRRMSRFVQFAVTVGVMAATEARLAGGGFDEDRAGVVFASAIGGTPEFQQAYELQSDHGSRPVRALADDVPFYDSVFLNFAPTKIARKFGLHGMCTSLTTGCTAGIDALGLGFDLIRHGELDIAVTGAAEAPLSGLAYATLDVIGSLAVVDCPPERASRPFDARRGGFVLGEGAAAVVLEEYEHARRRGARVFGEVLGFASGNNANHMTDLHADGNAMASVLRAALSDAAIPPESVDYVNAHGSSTPQNDIFETRALKTIFGSYASCLPISATKSMVGHSLSAASLTGTIASLGAFKWAMVPPTMNYEVRDPDCDLDYTPNRARPLQVRTAIVMASGFGGIHSCAVLRRVDDHITPLTPLQAGLMRSAGGTTQTAPKPAMLLLHGLGGSCRQWAPVLGALPDSMRAVAIDLPGHGDNTCPVDGDPTKVVSFLIDILDAADLSRPVGVVGHSLGGVAAMQLALAAPKRVAWLGLLSTAARVTIHPMLLAQFLAGTLDEGWIAAGMDPAIAAELREMLVADLQVLARRVHARSHAEIGAQGAGDPSADELCRRAARYAAWGLSGFDLRPCLHALNIPTLVITGGADPVVSPRKSRELCHAIADARLVALSGVGHYVHLEQPLTVADQLEAMHRHGTALSTERSHR